MEQGLYSPQSPCGCSLFSHKGSFCTGTSLSQHSLCKLAQEQGKDTRTHKCFRNWEAAGVGAGWSVRLGWLQCACAGTKPITVRMRSGMQGRCLLFAGRCEAEELLA